LVPVMVLLVVLIGALTGSIPGATGGVPSMVKEREYVEPLATVSVGLMVTVYDPSANTADGVKVIEPVVPLPEVLHVPVRVEPEAFFTVAPFNVEVKSIEVRASVRVKVTALGALLKIALFAGVVAVTWGGIVSRTTVRVTGRLL